MPTRREVEQLVALGSLPTERAALAMGPEVIERIEELVKSISPPLTLDEAEKLASVLGDDDCFGLAWSIVHLIETAEGWSLESLPTTSTEFAATLRHRLENGAD